MRAQHGNGRLVGFFSSLAIHLVVAILALSSAAQVRQLISGDATSAPGGTDGATHSAAVVRAGSYGAAATGTAQASQDPAEPTSAWPHVEASTRVRLALGPLLDHLWQSTAFALVAGLLTIPLRRNRARLRYALWCCASLKFLVPFTLLAPLGSRLAWPTAVEQLTQHPLVASIRDPLVHAGAATAAVWTAPSTPDLAGGDWRRLALLGLWACGALAIVAMRVRIWRRLQAIVQASTPMELPGVDIPASVQVRAAAGLMEPGVVGWINPVLLMPADIERHLTRPEIEAVVAHELCHVRRYDNLTAALHMVGEVLFWFHPLVWWIGTRLVDERERACDEHVLRTVGTPRSYAQGILNVCKRYVESPLASVSGVSSANVRKRIEAILANQVGEATGPWKRMALALAFLLVLVVPFGVGAVTGPRRLADARTAPSMLSLAGPSSASTASLDAGSEPRTTRPTRYALVVAGADGRLGPRVARSSRTNCRASVASASPCGVRTTPGAIAADSVMFGHLAALLADEIGQDVEDRTGLTGRFTFQLTWTADPGGPSIFTALQDQLGLSLVPLSVVSPEQRATSK